MGPAMGSQRPADEHDAISDSIGTCEDCARALAEHLEVVTRIAAGKLDAKLSDQSQRRLCRLLGEATNQMIETVRSSIEQHTRTERWIDGLNRMNQRLLEPRSLERRLKVVAHGVVETFDAEFARVWVVRPGDLCETGCIHAAAADEAHLCRDRSRCLHLVASSGRYTHIDGDHRRVPLGCYKIGRIASGQDRTLITNDVCSDPRVHDRAWAERLGLVSFAGYRIFSPENEPWGVLALFAKHPISPREDQFLESLATIVSRVLQLERVHRRLEEALIREKAQAERAHQANRAKSQFLANMSHDIRTPMNAVMGFCEILAEQDLEPEQLEYVRIIHNSAESLLELLNDILDLSKIEAGKLELNITTCTIESLVRLVGPMLAPLAEQKDLRFEITVSDSLPARIRTDPLRVRQCLVNLVSNAVKFTDTGHVFVRVLPEHTDGHDWVLFEVEDTGTGVPPEMHEAIFEPFTQARTGGPGRHGGTGLGLAIGRQIAELLGGSLTLVSQPGRGSVFSLRIPAGTGAELPGDQPGEQDQPTAAGRRKPIAECQQFAGNVLLAEDVATNQQLIKLALAKVGLEVKVVENGRAALEAALAEQFDLILMDIQMPVMNGYEATARLREKGICTPIIALTAHAMAGDREKCLQAGCDEYLAKPVELGRLIELLGKYLPSSDTRPAGQAPQRQKTAP